MWVSPLFVLSLFFNAEVRGGKRRGSRSYHLFSALLCVKLGATLRLNSSL